MALLQTYFDESYDDDILCVAGYIFTKLRCHKLARDWKEMLRRFGLPYFRMSSCAHGNGVFGGMSKEDRVLAQTLAMALVQRYASSGVAVTVERSAFDKYMGGDDFIKTPYEFCVWMCLVGVSNWADATSWSGNISYIFEAGHQHQSNANSMMHYIFSNQILRERYRYGGHAFVDKKNAPPCQAADLLAWQWYTQRKRMPPYKERPMRADLRVLLQKNHNTLHGSPALLLEARRRIGDITARYARDDH